jgi:NADPH2:quinone reductase
MKAVTIRSFGGPEVLEISDIRVPIPGSGQVRIKVAAAAVNPVDLQTRSGALAAIMPTREVIGLGWDVAGTIDALGAGVTDFAVGDRVIGLSDRLALPLKTHAEYVVLDADAIAPLPAGVDPVAASTLPLNGLTAAQALDHAGLRPGESLLVTGAAGGVGGYAVEIAARSGIRVAAVGREHDEQLVRDLGAEVFIADTEDVPSAVRDAFLGGVDAVIDAASLGFLALDAVRGLGAFVAVLGNAPLPLRGIRVSNVWIRADGKRLGELAAAGLRLRVAEAFPLEGIAQAHRRQAEGGLRGRLVLVP